MLLIMMNALIELLRKYFCDFKEEELERHFVGTHQEILRAVKDKDPERARDLMASDILEIKRHVEKEG